jgi:hypothetical protein
MPVLRARWWGALSVALAALAVLDSVLLALAEQGDAGEADQAVPPAVVVTPPGGGPSLACGVRPLPPGTDAGSRATFTCWVNGAPEGDTSFTLEAVRLGGNGELLGAIGTICGDTALANGQGTCTGTLVDPSGAVLIGGLVVRGTLQPSGTQLGPVHVSPTL